MNASEYHRWAKGLVKELFGLADHFGWVADGGKVESGSYYVRFREEDDLYIRPRRGFRVRISKHKSAHPSSRSRFNIVAGEYTRDGRLKEDVIMDQITRRLE